mgnify:CR=1 FL=1
MTIRPMTIGDYDEVFAMWQITSKRALSEADERGQIERYLNRNKGMSQVAVIDGKIVGTVLAGHDGRRGFIHYMAVLPEYRRQGIASALTSRLAIEILLRGKVPFYCAAWCNIRSVRNAVKSSFRPAWVEMTAKSVMTVDGMNNN